MKRRQVTNVLSKIRRLAEHKNPEINSTALLLYSLYELLHKKPMAEKRKHDLLEVVRAVEADLYQHTDADAPFFGYCFFISTIRRSLSQCFLLGRYLDKKQPLRQVQNLLEGNRCNRRDVALFIKYAYAGLLDEKEYRAKPILDEVIVY